jgi:phosphate starvation-inducible PhoH-like protein
MSRRKDAPGFTNASLTARTANQKHFIREINDHDITLCYGPPGTGKTHVAVGLAAEYLKRNQIDKIVICRPVVPSGCDIGYLPGSMEEKLAPWLQPLYDELSYYIDPRSLRLLREEGVIDVVPLTMMRGRTFKNSFVILDEAQNATFEELKMFLTRIGEGTKVVTVGDLNQSDLQKDKAGQYEHVIDLLEGMEGLAVVELDETDIVRHAIIGELEKRLSNIYR